MERKGQLKEPYRKIQEMKTHQGAQRKIQGGSKKCKGEIEKQNIMKTPEHDRKLQESTGNANGN